MADKHDEQLLGFSNLNKIFPIIDVVDDLNSDVTNRPLSAKQGKVLKEMINGITSFNYEIVTELPAVGQKGIIYLILNSASTEENNIYDEYIYINDKYEKLGSFTTQIDLSQIKDELSFIINAETDFYTQDDNTYIKEESFNNLRNAFNTGKLIYIILDDKLLFAYLNYHNDDIIINILMSNSIGELFINGTSKVVTETDKDYIYIININENKTERFNISGLLANDICRSIYLCFNNHAALCLDSKLSSPYELIYYNINDNCLHKLIENKVKSTDNDIVWDETIINDVYKINLKDISGNTITEENYNNILNAIQSGKHLIAELATNDNNVSIYNCYGVIDKTLSKIAFTLHITMDMYRNKELIMNICKDKTIYHYFDCIYININSDNTSDSIFQQCINTDFSINIYVSYKDAIYNITKVITNTVGENLILELISNNIKFKATVTQDATTQWEITYLSATDTELGDVLLGYKANGNNYPLQLNEEHRAFVNVPENRYDLNIDFLLENFKGTIAVEKYNEILNAIKSGKSIYVLGILSPAIGDESSINIYINHAEIRGWIQIDKTGAYYFIPDSFTLERSSYGSFPIDGFRYLFEDKDLLNRVDLKITDSDTVSVNVIDYNKTSEAITFKCVSGESFYYDCELRNGKNNIQYSNEYFYANNSKPGVIGVNYVENDRNYPVRLDESHNAFVYVPSGGKYDLDASFLSDGFRGTISTDKYNNIAGVIKDATENNIPIYMLGVLVNCTVDDSGINIIINIIGELDGVLLIKNTGEYIFIPKNIILTPGRYKFTTEFAYIFEYEKYLKYYVDSIYYVDNNKNKYAVVIIKDYNKTSDSITFKLVLSNLYYYDCSIDLTNENRYDLNVEDNGYIYPTGDDAGVIKLGYTQTDKNYPVQINEDGQAFVNVPWSGGTYSNATQTSDGLMSKEDKTKLDGLTGAATKILSQSEYDSLTNKDENTVYFIKG